MSSNSLRDERPEYIHMVVCGLVFLGVYALLRALHLSHPIASIAVVIAALPLMYVSAPLTALIYRAVSQPETRRWNLHVTDAGITTLIHFVLLALFISFMNNIKHKPQFHKKTPVTIHPKKTERP